MVAGGPDVGNWDADDKVPQEEENRAITASVAACITPATVISCSI